MAQTVRWNGKASADVTVKGSEDRSGYYANDYTSVNARVKVTNVSELVNDAGYLTLDTLPIYNGGVS